MFAIVFTLAVTSVLVPASAVCSDYTAASNCTAVCDCMWCVDVDQCADYRMAYCTNHVMLCTSRPTEVPKRSGLSHSQVVGLAVGLPLGVVIIALSICVCYLMKSLGSIFD